MLLAAVSGKLLGKLLNARLDRHAEKHGLLPETQAGFRAGGSCTNMIFVLRMAQEIVRTKDHTLYIVFVDLVTAYDSIAREGLWKIPHVRGVPHNVVALLKTFYERKTTRVFAEGCFTADVDLGTGLGQGCCVAPLLFNLFTHFWCCFRTMAATRRTQAAVGHSGWRRFVPRAARSVWPVSKM